jgi:polysaccharide pyruvyl transferase WcaK-like protein
MTDFLLVAWVSALIEARRFGWMMGLGGRWQPGEKLRLFFAGYNGTRNTGSDVRVEEMLRQIRLILGPENVDFSVSSMNFDRTRGYFQGTRQTHLPDTFPPFLFREVGAHHGVIACEGSMFKSKFANALTTFFVGALGLASAQNKLSLAYGAEAGHMDSLIEKMTARYVSESLVITRNPESQRVLSELGISTELGTDTAWTFEPHPPEYGKDALRKAGWDGSTPVLALCPIHPFVWPVRASLGKLVARTITGAYKESQYRGPYFFTSGTEVDRKFQHYVSAFVRSTAAFRAKYRVFPILVAMERLDTVACRAIAAELPGVPVFTSNDYDMFEMVSVLRQCAFMVSSRYHAIVTSMPALVASAGVTMDERIRNLMRERGHDHLFLTVDDLDLEPKMLAMMEKLVRERDSVREGIGQAVVRNLKSMARMGIFLEDAVRRTYPQFPLRVGVLSWRDYLPPLSDTLQRLLDTYDAEPVASRSAVG